MTTKKTLFCAPGSCADQYYSGSQCYTPELFDVPRCPYGRLPTDILYDHNVIWNGLFVFFYCWIPCQTRIHSDTRVATFIGMSGFIGTYPGPFSLVIETTRTRSGSTVGLFVCDNGYLLCENVVWYSLSHFQRSDNWPVDRSPITTSIFNMPDLIRIAERYCPVRSIVKRQFGMITDTGRRVDGTMEAFPPELGNEILDYVDPFLNLDFDFVCE